MKVYAPSQSIDWIIGVSSRSGSYKAGNLRGTISSTASLLSFKEDLNIGGPVCLIKISKGTINELSTLTPSVGGFDAKLVATISRVNKF